MPENSEFDMSVCPKPVLAKVTPGQDGSWDPGKQLKSCSLDSVSAVPGYILTPTLTLTVANKKRFDPITNLNLILNLTKM